MGKTYKDQNKYDRKRRERQGEDESLREHRKGGGKRRYEEIIPDDDELDPYEHLNYDYED